jgi:Mg-chelatase subunit ChlD/2'-5' RNA ligase
LRNAHDPQVKIWPPHINLLYPFVPEGDFEGAARRLAEAVAALGSMKIRFCRKGSFGPTAYLFPECAADPGLARLHAACVAAFPDLPVPDHGFAPHLTIGRFKDASECTAFLDSCPHIEIETEVNCLSLLARDSMVHPFRTAYSVRIGGAGLDSVAAGDPRPYAFRDVQSSTNGSKREVETQCSFYQLDDSCVRLAFELDADDADGSDVDTHPTRTSASRHTLFVVDQSSSMRSAYDQVKTAVRYMVEESNGKSHDLSFVLYNHEARRATSEVVLDSRAEGRTSFQAAFFSIIRYIDEKPSDASISIIFMTDGQDTASASLPQSKREFAQYLKTCGKKSVVIHAIGFTRSHERSFLQEMCLMGSSEGMYRYADESGGLESKFTEMFDFADINVKTSLRVGNFEKLCDAQDAGEGRLRVDVMVHMQDLGADFPAGKEPLHVVVNERSKVVLAPVACDPMFVIRKVDDMDITTQAALDKAQQLLSGVQVHKASKALRQDVGDARQDSQARLDKYHQLFAQKARSGVAMTAGNLAAEMSSLRHEVTFSKARRARAMAQRATTNASAMQLMDQFLRVLPEVTPADVADLEAQQLCCTLSGDTAADVMRDSHRDFFVFALRVRRPEDVIDAPIALEVIQVLSGTYANSSFRAGTEHAVKTGGPEQAHGGFVGSMKNPVALGSDVGLFRGPDGEMMNACLPLYLSEAHFARVRVQLKPILGYFFTLDPLGYKGDQTIAIFGVLGTMLCRRALSQDPASDCSFTGSWADWLVADFSRFCRGVQPIAMEYLQAGGYTGAARGDLMEDFVASPMGRSKERLPSLAVLVGWATAAEANLTLRFHVAFVEELWRRNFTALYKGQPHQPIAEALEKLLYGPDDGGGEGTEDATHPALVGRNRASKDKEFALWALFLRGDLAKKQAEDTRKKYAGKGPEIEDLLNSATEFNPRTPLQYDDAPDFFDAVMEAELTKIRRANSSFAALFEGRPFGEGFDASTRRIMLIQSLQFVGNDAMNEGCAKGGYLNTFDYIEEASDASGGAACRTFEKLHQRFEQQRQEKVSAYTDKRNALRTAQRILATENMDSFAGRCAVSCPTRGGAAFECLVGLLAASGDSCSVPLLREKIEAVLTGKIGSVPVISDGTSWIHCPLETSSRFKDAVGEDAFAEIELLMRGTWGHAYRTSDIPNRHKHCNSNPNLDLVKHFSGFGPARGSSGGS